MTRKRLPFRPGVEALESSVAADSIDVRGAEFEPPTNFSQAGQGGISVGAIALDRNHPAACWFWALDPPPQPASAAAAASEAGTNRAPARAWTAC